MDLPGDAKELYHSMIAQGQDREIWKGKRVFECPSADLEALEDVLWHDVWTRKVYTRTEDEAGTPGDVYVYMGVKGMTVDPHARLRRAIVVATYGTVYNGATHPTGGYATIGLVSHVEPGKVYEVKTVGGNARVLNRVENDGTVYKLVGGHAFNFQHGSKVLIRTAYPRAGINWPRILGAHDKVNLNYLPNLGNAGPRTMRLMGATIPKYYLAGPQASALSIVPITYEMWYNEKTWDQFVGKVKQYKRIPKAEPVAAAVDAKGKITSYQQRDSSDEPTPGVEEGTRYTVVTRDFPVAGSEETVEDMGMDTDTFSHLMGLLAWMSN